MIGYPEAPRYPQLIQALTGDTELVAPGLTLESDRPEWFILKREYLFAATQSLNASVGNFNEFALGLPAASAANPMLAVITALVSDQDVQYGLSPSAITGMASGNFGQPRDSRIAGKTQVRVFTKQPAAGVFDSTNSAIARANVYTKVEPFVLTFPARGVGTLFLLESLVVNIGQRIAIFGYTRGARPEEVQE